MSTASVPRYTPEEYLARERSAASKSEYYMGEIFAMAGASESHNLIVSNLVREFGIALRHGPCRVYPSDLRIKIPRTGLYTYPDLSIVCENPLFDDDKGDTLINPLVLIEVLSDSTEAYDRGTKFQHYRKVGSLATYVLVSQKRCEIEIFSRQPDNHWLLSHEANGIDNSVLVPPLEITLQLRDIYDKVTFHQNERDLSFERAPLREDK